MIRKEELKVTQINHVLNLNLVYALSKKTALYIGGKIMANQFNGEIPYLYINATKTSFDHKYGYAQTGIMFRF